MPKYDYKCLDCGNEFTQKTDYEKRDEVSCLFCGKDNVKRLVSGFLYAKTGSTGGSPSCSSGSCSGCSGC